MPADFNPQIFKLKSNLRTIVVIVIVIVIVIVGLAVYFTWPSGEKGVEQPAAEEIVPEETIPEEMQKGEVGELEIKEGQTMEEVLGEMNPEALVRPLQSPGTSLPQVINNTSGVIISVEKDAIIVKGNGSNFEDQISRELTIKVVAQTTIFEKNQAGRYQGPEGLKYLAPGVNVAIESLENIRGKTEFTASYINKI